MLGDSRVDVKVNSICLLSFESIWSNGRGRPETNNYSGVLSAATEMWSNALELERRKETHLAQIKSNFGGNKRSRETILCK